MTDDDSDDIAGANTQAISRPLIDDEARKDLVRAREGLSAVEAPKACADEQEQQELAYNRETVAYLRLLGGSQIPTCPQPLDEDLIGAV